MRLLPAVLIGGAATGWACWLLAVPAVARPASSGPVLWAAAATYRAGSVICHQRDARSFHVDGVRMPVCTRCFGLYAGAALGALAAIGGMVARRRHPSGAWRIPLDRLRSILLAGAAPTLGAWLAEHVFGAGVPGLARALAAAPLGAAVAAFVTCWAAGASFHDTADGSAIH